MIDYKQIEDLVRQEVEKKISSELKALDIGATFQASLAATIAEKSDVLVTNVLNRMITENSLQNIVNTKLVAGLQTKLEKEVAAKVSGLVSRVDVGQLISDKVVEIVDTKLRTGNLPDKFIPQKAVDLSNLTIRPEQVTGPGKFKTFVSQGIQDTATELNLAVSDGLVVVNRQLSTTDLVVSGTASVRDLEVTGTLKVSGAFTKGLTSLIDDRLTAERANWKLDILGGALYANGQALLTESTLAPTVTTSNLRKVGNLVELTVAGDFNVGEALTVQGNKVGINTVEPDGALTVWDQETEFTVRRQSSRTTYIGTLRDNKLAIGVGGDVIVKVNSDGIEVPTVIINGLSISVSDNPPSVPGTPGELVIMRRAVAGQPWAYQCLEGQTWAAMVR